MIRSTDDLVAFLRHFHRGLLPEPGLDPARVPAGLPDALAAVYRGLGALVAQTRAFSTHDTLFAPDRLDLDGPTLWFASENQACWAACCPRGEPDPPVFFSADSNDLSPTGETASRFVATLCLQEAVMSCRNLAFLEPGAPVADVLSVPVTVVWANGRLADAADRTFTAGRTFYASADGDVLVMEWGEHTFWVASPHRPVAEAVRSGLFPGPMSGE